MLIKKLILIILPLAVILAIFYQLTRIVAPQTVEAPPAVKVERVEVEQRITLGGGISFGAYGQYESLKGKVYYLLNPSDSANLAITDIEYAPTVKGGLVRYSTEFLIVKPLDMSRSNGALVYHVVNRGNFDQRFLESDLWGELAGQSAGSQEKYLRLMQQGYTLVFSGWQGDLLPDSTRLHLNAPLLKGADFLPGKVLAEIEGTPEQKVAYLGAESHIAYPLADGAEETAEFRVHESYADPGTIIAKEKYSFLTFDSDSNLVADRTHIYYPDGFEYFKIYTVVYKSSLCPVMGLSMSGVRDLIDFLKSDNRLNPLLDAEADSPIKWAIAFGSSQSGRFLRNFLYDGFNVSPDSGLVFDGVFENVPGCRKGFFNYRFAQPSRYKGFYPDFEFPFTHGVSTDPITGRSGGILERYSIDKQPKIFTVHHSSEYWCAGSALTHTDPVGVRDIQPPDNVRIYLLSGTAHGYEPVKDATPEPGTNYDYRLPFNPHMAELLDVPLFDRLCAWVMHGEEPPASAYPSLADETLMAQEFFTFPNTPGVSAPVIVDLFPRYDWGRDYEDGILIKLPPGIGALYPQLVPAVGDDGNEIAGLRSPLISVPVASFTGWNYSSHWLGVENSPDQSLSGAWLPFSRTRVEKRKLKDGRPSLDRLYKNRQDYLNKLKASCDSLAGQKLFLREDTDQVLEIGGQLYDYVQRFGPWIPSGK